ncbi:MAG: OmpA family protein [Bryobacterales bacterium]|nr:OmpA family protein [Bryobacterales bacterium]
MARKKRHEEHANHERWLVSYADFITLLFAFFVVMFASSQTDKGKAAQVSESVKRALEENQIASAMAGILGGTVGEKGVGNAMMRGPGGATKALPEAQAKDPRVAELLPSQMFLNHQLKEEIGAGKVVVHMGARGLVVSLQEAAFFPSGGSTVDEAAYTSLAKIAESIRLLPNPIRLEGHTDSVPIHNDRFASNWDLSAARAIAMLQLFTEHFELDKSKFSVAGYADVVPVESNATAEGRARNRRVDIVILNKAGLTEEPAGRK